METRRKLPIGVQNFEKVRRENRIYVDKTKYLYSLVQDGVPYFLSRPRRFGKSLFLSALRCYWEGKKELFRGLAIEELEKDNEEAFSPYPVFYFDFNKANYMRKGALEDVLNEHLEEWESLYGVGKNGKSLEARFQSLIVKANEATSKRAVVLVDEYDKPLLEAMADKELEEHNKAVFKGFFSALKSYDGYLQFVFLTGVTKFSKVSIFSDLNHLVDISMDKRYSGICGITHKEMLDNLMPEISRMAKENEITKEECLERLKKMYDGYYFCEKTEGVYNPFSLLNALREEKFKAYWFSTGTPTFLIEKLKKANYDIKSFTDGSIRATARELSDYRADDDNPVPLFYQTGYLTIKGYKEKYEKYILGYPNSEVEYAFIESLAPIFLNTKENPGSLDISLFGEDIEEARLDSLRDRFAALYASLPYVTDERVLEQNFQNVAYIVFTLLGQYVKTEVQSAKGRADVIVETDDYVYIFEFKRDATAAEALEQIEKMGYGRPYEADPRKLYKIGASFDSKERTLEGWEVKG